MPELPEVESIKLQLQKYVVGHTIVAVDVRNAKTFPEGSVTVTGGKIINIRRFGKVLVVDLSNGFSMVIHVKMTGQFIYRGPNLKNPSPLSGKVLGGLGGKHTHVVFTLDRGGMLYFNDVRKFGWIKVVATNEVEKVKFIEKLGPEPLFGLTFETFKTVIGSGKRCVKVMIMDQEKIGGVGNIYANDALFLAGIHPGKVAHSLSDKELHGLFNAIETVLRKGIISGGASENSFVTPDGTDGEYQNHTLVYGKDEKECSNKCGSVIAKIQLGGRGTYFCPNCQKI